MAVGFGDLGRASKAGLGFTAAAVFLLSPRSAAAGTETMSRWVFTSTFQSVGPCWQYKGMGGT